MRSLVERILMDLVDAVDYFLESLIYVGDSIGGFVVSLITNKIPLTTLVILAILVISLLGI